ncbi:KamA family radical SAM protein [Chondromyces apiculatus]|uniref:Lysine 2,3-aminomutase n=1 Tax=Chondromyces apiculatus DSM 436 TaxID=1192034 RepID=A0A017STX5_9BACT|nr:KamA family radical SAM protein [Chondromyces apiculatus]EYF00419.1 Lysine 2,3-aminomutase [Chondromyces apiculatus DSM 436]
MTATPPNLIELGKKAAPGIVHLKPPVDPATLKHRNLLEAPDWRRIPAYADVTEEQFLDHRWQSKKTITRPDKLLETLKGLVSEEFIRDATEGFQRAPMSVRVSPYLMSLIDWNDPYHDPLRIQFIPLASRLLPDHPKLGLDSLHERADAPVPGLTHRYPDKALFLPLDTCPVYCRFCTRSYAVGIDTDEVEKTHFRVDEERWRRAFEYIAARPELEDIVVSGGDAYNLRPEQVTQILETLLKLPNIQRIRVATKGPAVMPQKILTDHEWVDAVTRGVDLGRKLHKEVVLHTHFNNPNEITGITRDAMNKLFERGVTVRNQSVLQRGVNDAPETMKLLVKRLGQVHVHPYYVYVHDLVQGVEDLRTTLETALMLEKHVRGTTAGFNTPTFVVDAPGGGGKRDAHSFEYYDRITGISVYQAPSVKPGQRYIYFDPITLLPPEGQARWADPQEHQRMLDEALSHVSDPSRGRA